MEWNEGRNTGERTRRSSRLPKTGPELDDVSLAVCDGLSCFGGDSFFGSGGGAGFEVSGLDSCFASDLDSAGFASDLPPSSLGGSLDSDSGFAPPASILAISWPTVTVSSSLASSSVMVPASGALTATSI